MIVAIHTIVTAIYDYYTETLEGIGELLRIIREKERNSEQERSASRDAFSRVIILLSSLLVEIIFNKCIKDFINNNKNTINKKVLEKIEKDKKEKKGIKHKIKKWPSLLTGKEFDFGSEPFQSYEKLRRYRNAVAHNEFNNYHHITDILDTYEGAIAAVSGGIEVSKTIEKHFFPDKRDFSYQEWVKEFGIPKSKVKFQKLYNEALGQQKS